MIQSVSLFTLPLLYEKYEDQFVALGEKPMIEIKKQYAMFGAKVLSHIHHLSSYCLVIVDIYFVHMLSFYVLLKSLSLF